LLIKLLIFRFFFKANTRLLPNVIDVYKVDMAGSSMRLVTLKPHGPGPDSGPGRPVQKQILQRKFAVL